MYLERSIKELLQKACASIRHRLLHEVLREKIPAGEAQILEEQILRDGLVRGILSSQSPQGWFGKSFHGYDSHEAGIRVLLEKGLRPTHPCLSRALRLVESNSERIAREMGIVGKALDEGGFGGTNLMRAALLAMAGLEKREVVREQLDAALEVFRTIPSLSTVDEIAEPYKGKLVFKPGISWPGIYHLRLLAFTTGWRSQVNMRMAAEAIARIVRLAPLPYISVRYRSQIIAPAAFAMQDFDPEMASMSAPQWMMWFHRMELLARMGVAGSVPEIQAQISILGDLLEEGGGWFTRPVKHEYFSRWGAYTGLRLEKDWKTAWRRQSDLTFRSLLILKYSNMYS
jgi:hypothetical protein